MREYRDYMGPEASRPWTLGQSPAVKGLIVANVAIFFASILAFNAILPVFFGRQVNVGRLFEWVGLSPPLALGKGYVWQFVTYAFFHRTDEVLHLVFNMLALYFFGREVEALYGTAKFLFLYVAAAVFAGLCFCLDYHLGAPAIGASGAVYAVMVVFALHFPFQKVLVFFLLPLEVWIVVLIAIAFDASMYLARGSGDNVAHLAHLGGAAFGYLFYRFQHRVESYIEHVEGRMAKKEQAHEEELEARVDTILEKINREGMGALSKKELDLLKKASKHYQKKA
jgi:membrane associated rhomboid family serine protease